MFPLTTSGSFEHGAIRPKDVPLISQGIAEMMLAVKADDVVDSGGTVTFRGGLFRGGMLFTWDYLQFVGVGEITVTPGDPGRIAYNFSRHKQLLAGLALALIPASMALFVDRDPRGAVEFMLFAGALLGLLYPAVDAVQLRRLVRHAAGPVAGVRGVCACPECGLRYDPADYRPDVVALCERCHAPLPIGECRPADLAS